MKILKIMKYTISYKTLLFCIFLTLTNYNLSADINLSEADRNYIKYNPVITMGYDSTWYPYTYSENGKAKGMLVDYIEELADLIGIDVLWSGGATWSEQLSHLRNRSIDAIPTMIETGDRKDLSFTNPYFNVTTSIVSLIENNIDNPDNNKVYSIAIPHGWAGEYIIKNLYPTLKVRYVSDSKEAFNDIYNKKVDYFCGDLANILYETEKYPDRNIFSIRNLNLHENASKLKIGTTKEKYLLLSLLNKAIASIPKSKTDRIINNWFKSYIPPESFFIDYGSLTIIEKEWLNNHKKLTGVSLQETNPISFFGRNGQFHGITSDYIKEFEKQLGIHINIRPDIKWKDGLGLIAENKIDMIAAIVDTPERRRSMIFTKPYLTENIFIYSKDIVNNIENISDLYNYKVVTRKNFSLVKWLKNDLPGLEITEVNNIHEGLKLIRKKPSYVLVDSMFATNFEINNNGYTDVFITGTTPYKYEIGISLQKQHYILRDILNKSIDRIQAENAELIKGKWLTHNTGSFINKQLVFRISFIILLLLFLITLWGYFSYRQKITAQQLAGTDSLTGLKNRRDLVKIFDSEKRRADRNNIFMCFCILDLDNFKLYNDVYGHSKGDEALIMFADLLKETFKRESDYIFRLGGEEFGCLISVKNDEDYHGIIDRIRHSLEKKAVEHKKNKPFKVITVSGGISKVTLKDERDFSQIYHDADTALYQAKKAGRNKILTHNISQHQADSK